MEDLLQVQIQDSCRLALPNGLKDLMSDISREVLRAQPKNLLQFITDYLSAMLVTRENLNAASRVCDDVCENMKAADLEDELREKGILEDDIKTISELVSHHLERMSPEEPVKEGQLLSKIIQKTTVDEEHIGHVLKAVHRAFLRHQIYNTTIYEMTPDSSMDEITRAAHHTIDLYRKTKPTDSALNQAAGKIQAAYRAYGVRRQKETEMSNNEWVYAPEIVERAGLEETKEIDIAEADLAIQHITVDVEEADDGYHADTESHFADSRSVATNASEKTDDVCVFPMRVSTVSSSSLAGSFIHLPKHKPYTIIDESIRESDEPDAEEVDEKQKQEHFNVDYTKEVSMEATGPLLDYEVDDTSSVEEVIHMGETVEEEMDMGERKVVFVDSIDDLDSTGSSSKMDD